MLFGGINDWSRQCLEGTTIFLNVTQFGSVVGRRHNSRSTRIFAANEVLQLVDRLFLRGDDAVDQISH